MFRLGLPIGASAGVLAGLVLVETLPELGAWVLAALLAAATVVVYVIANAAAGRTADGLRHALVGLNAGLNAVLAMQVFGTLIGVALGVLVGVAVLPLVSTNGVYQGLLGWANWVLPMSWPIVALGLGFSAVNLLGHAVTIGRVPYLRVRAFRVDLSTGTFFTRGGFVANLNHLDTAFNMGNFAFVDVNASDWHLDHEAGHTLNLAAFGSLFHLIGAVDENVTGGGVNALSERLAESNDPHTTLAHLIIPMWT